MGPRGLNSVSARTITGVIAGVDSGIQQLDAVVKELASSNTRQWNLEDVSRSSASDNEVASAKREIDACNAYRTRCIAELDELFGVLVSEPAAPPVTESPGSVIDRLTVMTIRLEVLADQPNANPEGASCATVRTQHEQLLVAFDRLLLDLRSGARSYLGLPTVKVYRGEALEVL